MPVQAMYKRLDAIQAQAQAARPVLSEDERLRRLAIVVDVATAKGVDNLPEPERGKVRQIMALLGIAQERLDANAQT